MSPNSFYDDRKFCTACDDYVAYLAGMDRSYCVQCGSKVRLFSEEDWNRFQNGLDNRPRNGRKVKNTGNAAAIFDAQAQEAIEPHVDTEGDLPDDQRESA